MNKKKKIRNPFAIAGRGKKGGPMRNKKDKRKNGKNKKQSYLDEEY